MITQITMTRNELFLLREMLPIWQKYADSFVFFVDNSNDGTYEFLQENKEKYNILSILSSHREDHELFIETDIRQALYDEAFKYSKNIICLDSDEYLDGDIDKKELEYILENNRDCTFHLNWIQYTGIDTIRIDGPWENNLMDRIGSYEHRALFNYAQMHSTHLPSTNNNLIFNKNSLFIAHLQWLDKKNVAIKQYFWKITDYINNLNHNINTFPPSAYDSSVNNFDWKLSKFSHNLKIDPNIYSKLLDKDNYKLQFIKEQTQKYNIPNLGDWGMNIYEK
jgi:hypothetical protein